MSIFSRIFCSTWTSKWNIDDETFQELRYKFPAYHTDFRDTAPPSIEEVNENYDPIVQEGRWTVGLFDMWCPKAINAKHAVHVPCCSSFRLNPLKWRGWCLGRTWREFYWSGLYQARWARMVYAANLGKEYVLPVRGVGHGFKSEIEALCWMYCLMGCVFSCGIGQIFSLCGNFGLNFAAFFSCRAREKMRRRYRLPPAFGMPPGIDDFLVHTFCSICSSHQEMRELAVRGIDGPGMHVLDMVPQSYAAAPGGQKAIDARKAVLETMLANPPKSFKRRPHEPERGPLGRMLTDAKLGAKVAYNGAVATFTGEGEEDETESASEDLGWRHIVAPGHQHMSRDGGTPLKVHTMLPLKVVTEEQAAEGSTEEPRPMEKAWTVAY